MVNEWLIVGPECDRHCTFARGRVRPATTSLPAPRLAPVPALGGSVPLPDATGAGLTDQQRISDDERAN